MEIDDLRRQESLHSIAVDRAQREQLEAAPTVIGDRRPCARIGEKLHRLDDGFQVVARKEIGDGFVAARNAHQLATLDVPKEGGSAL